MEIHKHRKQNTNPLNDQSICLSCRSSDHSRSKCRFRNATGHKCNKEGHIAKACRSNITSNESDVNTISSATRKRTTGEQPIQVVTHIDGLEVKFELHTVGDKNRNNILGRNWINPLHLNETTLDELINNSKVRHGNSKISNLNALMHSYNDPSWIKRSVNGRNG
ncbi:unnamed protein product [Rotaria magnacalcarata]|uniref:CCHC-type domain-containing protein n=1 Tax=Rotaria magnacalcarata TaxID=392030 RepID=A0A819S617_9BILA|nr:unnamed protein product [Rotaria magnacalcarata]